MRAKNIQSVGMRTELTRVPHFTNKNVSHPINARRSADSNMPTHIVSHMNVLSPKRVRSVRLSHFLTVCRVACETGHQLCIVLSFSQGSKSK